MPYARPTLTGLRQQAAADISSSLPGADGLLRFSNLGVIGNALAGMANLHYGYLDWISQQGAPYTSTGEFLQGWGALKNVYQQAATAASGTITFNGVAGTDLPQGSLVQRGDGRTYATTADATVSGGGTVTAPALDQTPGAAGNCDEGTLLTLASAIPGIQSNGTAASNFTGGNDVQSEDSFRSDVLEAYQNPPQGGAQNDYITWALAVAGVTRARVLPNGQGAGTVVVYFMMDESESAYNGFPQGTNGVATDETRDSAATGDQLAVANAIYPLQPVTALVYACAPTASPQNFTIASLNPSTTVMKAAIEAAISDVFLREGAPGGTIALADVNAAIDAVPGIVDFIITSPTADITTSTGGLATLGTVTWA